jgi:hypothetical protein
LKKTEYELKEIDWQSKNKELHASIHDRERRIEQITQELKNSELMLTLKTESEKELQNEYQRSLLENRHLVESLNTQLNELNKYMVEKKEFNDTHSKIYAELSVINKNLIEKQEDIDKSRKAIKDLRLSLDEKYVEVDAIERKNQQLHIDLG